MDRTDLIADRLAISDLVHSYAQAVDRKDIEGLADLFCEEGRLVVFTEPDAQDPLTVDGRSAIRESLSDLHRYRSTFHAIANHTASVDGDGDRATAVTGCIAHHVTGTPGAERDRVWYLRYTDTLIREPQGWRFSVRELRVEIVTRGPLVSD